MDQHNLYFADFSFGSEDVFLMVWFIIAGLLFGIVGGMGLGGGIVLIPVLTLLLGMDQHSAQGANLFAFIPMAIAALCFHIRKKRVRFKPAILMCLAGAAGAIGGAILGNVLEADLLRKLFGGFLILLAGYRIFLLIKKKTALQK